MSYKTQLLAQLPEHLEDIEPGQMLDTIVHCLMKLQTPHPLWARIKEFMYGKNEERMDIPAYSTDMNAVGLLVATYQLAVIPGRVGDVEGQPAYTWVVGKVKKSGYSWVYRFGESADVNFDPEYVTHRSLPLAVCLAIIDHERHSLSPVSTPT